MGSSKEDVLKLVEEHNPAVLAFQETFHGNNFISKIKYYNGFCKQGHFNRRYQGGVSLYLHNSFPYTTLDIQSNLQVIAIRVQLNYSRIITVASLYLPPSINVSVNDLDNLISQLPQPFIILGDFNAHHTSWDTTRNDARGNMLYNFLSNNNLICLKTIIPTHISGSSIDLTICSPELTDILDWNVLPSVLSSDHLPIIIKMTSANADIGNIPPRFNYKAANWDLYYIDPSWDDIPNPENIQNNSPINIFNDVMKRINTAADRCIPKFVPQKYYPRPFWNDECKNLWNERERLYRRYKATHCENIKIQWKRTRALAKQKFKHYKKEAFTSFLSNMNHTTPITNIYNKLRQIRGHPPRQLSFLIENNNTHSSPKDLANCLGRSFARISNYDNHPPIFKNNRIQWENKFLDFSSNNIEKYNNNFIEREMENALNSCSNTSPGPDQITYRMIKELPNNMKTYILYMFNTFWRTAFFPDDWRLATVLAFLKPNKESTNPLSYRPIALTSCICKIFEKMINQRLVHFLEMNKLITNIQCGFRKTRSTIDHLTRLDTYIRKGFASNSVTTGIFFDLEKAYDTTWRYGIMRDLHNMGLRGRLPLYIDAFLQERRFRVSINNHLSDVFTQIAGVPQGSILSVTLFSVKINSIAQIIPPTVHPSLFVDDLQLSYTGYNMEEINQHLQPVLNKISHWATTNGFKFSSDKTHCIAFHQSPSYAGIPTLKLNGKRIPCKQHVKFLGLHMDTQLNWKHHISQLKANSSKALNLLRTLAHNNSGADQQTLLHTYRLVIRPKLDYGCIIYGAAPKATLRELDAIHNEALRICSGAFRSTPVESLYVLLNEPSLEDRRKMLLCRYYYKLRAIINNPARNCLMSNETKLFFRSRNYITSPIIIRTENTMKLLKLPTEPVLPHRTHKVFSHEILIPTIDISLAQIGVKNIFNFSHYFYEHAYHNYPRYTHIYTDGSKTNYGVGAAATSEHGQKTASLPLASSIFTAEVHALKMACDIIKEQRVHRNYLICSDSLSAVQSLLNTEPFNETIRRLQIIVHELLSKNIKIVFLWIPGHSNFNGNMKADQLARKETSKPPTLIPVPYTDFYPIISDSLFSSWNSRWISINTQLREIFPTLRGTPRLKFRRNQEVVHNRLLTGHTRLTHGYLMDNNIRPSCLWCCEPISIKHILLECREIALLRNFFFDIPEPISLSNLLNDMNVIPHVFDFLKTLNIYNEL